MKSPRRVIWSEGLLMLPQHMQQLDSYHEDLLAARLNSLEQDAWGVLTLEIDPQALIEGSVGLSQFSGVLPDGTPLSFDASQPEAVASRPVEQHFASHQSVLEVYIGLPRMQDARNNLGASKGDISRYTSWEGLSHDRYGEHQPEQVGFACPNARLLFGEEPRQDFSAIKIAEIKRAADGALVVSDDYIPPCLRISAAPGLVSLLSVLLTSMNARRGVLLEKVRQRDDATVEYSAPDVTRFLLLGAINTHLPVLKHLVDARDLSPKSVFLFLSQLAGQLSTFSTAINPADLPSYVFTDLRQTFDPLMSAVMQLLDATLQERSLSVTLASRGDGLFLGELADPRFAKCERFVLGVASNVSEQEVSAKLPLLAKLASATDINSLLAAATPGGGLQSTSKPPPQIPTRAGASYFVVRTESDYWRNVLIESKLALYLPAPFDAAKTEVTLYGIVKG